MPSYVDPPTETATDGPAAAATGAAGAGEAGRVAGLAVVYLVRHGRTGLNASGVLRGRLDPPIDDVGRREAAVLGRLFRHVDLAGVVTSPLLRARQTASQIAEATGVPLVCDDRLVDRDHGPWTGVSSDKVRRRFGSLDAAPGVEPAGAPGGSGGRRYRGRGRPVAGGGGGRGA